MDKNTRVMVGLPSSRGQYGGRTLIAVAEATGSSPFPVYLELKVFSEICTAFNSLLCSAVEHRFPYLCLLHADVGPLRARWLERMVGTLIERRLAALALHIPLRREGGMTSTALETAPGLLETQHSRRGRERRSSPAKRSRGCG